MRSYLINLDRAPERLAYMTQQFAVIGAAFERVTAVDGKELSTEATAKFRAERDPSGWLPGQIGALLSHMEAWRRVVEGADRWGVIFEDDIHLHPTLAELLSSDDWIPEEADLIRLETTRQGMRLGQIDYASPSCAARLLAVTGGAWGAGAYLIERRVARWFLATPARLQAPVDSLLFQQPKANYPPGLITLQIDPAPCIQDKYYPFPNQRLGFDSAIEGTMSLSGRVMLAAKLHVGTTARRVLGKRVIAFAGEAIISPDHSPTSSAN